MKRLILILALCSPAFGQILSPILAGATAAGPTITFVQESIQPTIPSPTDCAGTFTTSVVCPFPGALTNGNTLLTAVAIHTTGSDTVTGITGTGISGSAKVGGTVSATTDCEVWKSAIGVSPGSSITVAITGSVPFSFSVKSAEFHNLSTTVDGTAATKTGTGTSAITNAYSNTNATDLIVGAMCAESSAAPGANPAGYTNLTYTASNIAGGTEGVQFSYKIVSATGAQSATWGIASVDWVTVLGALQQ